MSYPLRNVPPSSGRTHRDPFRTEHHPVPNTTVPPIRGEAMLIDCDTCTVRGNGCDECVVAALYGPPVEALDLDADERRAVQVLIDAGFEVSGVPVAPPQPAAPARRAPRQRVPSPGWRRGRAA